ncbi:class 1 fructose-bisphosphatase [Bradyrhizobium sp. WD16]|uniref:class 1 fructose-bisphosphatase n=1 Tax=Bradyrhizobium sp. WD16 TaxID=1521768 RepID=UPI0020A47E5C|nr:class 1 fructose-bisphosphatase [Bradyrhizobium sp. WD16]UTD28086.1 class 1 fructose-bisphosphatase [Bradyrhizobium sp. WD16]
MGQAPTLFQHTRSYAAQDARSRTVASAVNAIAAAAIEISELIGHGSLAGITGAAQGGRNADGDAQTDLDLHVDALIRAALRPIPIDALVSEESVEAERGDAAAPIAIAYDPLDGSSNIDTNVSVGTIFSIMPAGGGVAAFSRPGSEQLAAGFVIYGPQTSLVLTVGDGVDIFTLDRQERVFRRIGSQVQVPVTTAEYAINASNYRHWDQPVRDFIDECVAGADGPRGKEFNMRWIGSLVAEAYRILRRGGVFLYPGDGREGYGEGRLRLLYEANPMAFIMEQAGGAAVTGRSRVLDLLPGSIHQRVPLVMGSIEKVRHIELLHNDPAAASRVAPLFARRGLFRA